MSRHEGVSCDSCMKGNFRGRRYKCLVCYDYDLCDACYESGATNTRHTTDHPVQCILTRADFDLFYAGEAITNVDQPQAYTCPYCSRMGFTDVTLQEHVTTDHGDTSFEVVCPVCAAMPGGDPNLMTDDFAGHLTIEHRSGTRDLITFLDEPVGGNRRRVPHSGHMPSSRGGSSGRPRRSNMHFSVFSSTGMSSLSPSSREPVDPIAELLSQLSGVRRSGSSSSTPSQLQQLQMQLQLERQQVSAARQQLERLPRRQNQIQTLREASANANPGYMPNATNTQAQAASTAPSAPAPPSDFLLEGLLEDLSLNSSTDKNTADRLQFINNLLFSTTMDVQKKSELEESSVEEVDSDEQRDTLSSLAVTFTDSSRTFNRVLRGRARSDNQNALRRADANKVQDCKKAKKTAISR